MALSGGACSWTVFEHIARIACALAALRPLIAGVVLIEALPRRISPAGVVALLHAQPTRFGALGRHEHGVLGALTILGPPLTSRRGVRAGDIGGGG